MTKSIEKNLYYDDALKRLLDALDALGLGGRGRVKKIADDTQYSSNQVSWFLLGRVPLHKRFLDSVCTKYRINQRWVISGEGEMFVTPITGTSHERLQLGEKAVGQVGPASIEPPTTFPTPLHQMFWEESLKLTEDELLEELLILRRKKASRDKKEHEGE